MKLLVMANSDDSETSTLKAKSNGSNNNARMQPYISGGCNEAALSCCNKQCVQNTAELVKATMVASPADCSCNHIVSTGSCIAATA